MVDRRVMYSLAVGGLVRADRVYIATTAIRAGIWFCSKNEAGSAVSAVVSDDVRRARFRDGVPVLCDLSLIAFRMEDTPVKTCGDAAGVSKALHRFRITVINHSGSSPGAALGRFPVEFGVRVFDGAVLLGVAFFATARDFFDVMAAGGGADSGCVVVARAVLR
jgi:hypothetical protein